MPLTPLPEDNTKRYFVNVLVGTQQHSQQFRCADTVDDATAITHLTSLGAAIQPTIGSNVVWASVDVALKNSNVRNPVGGWTPITGTGTAVSGTTPPFSWCISGRSPTGRKVKSFLYGIGLSIPSTYKQDPLTDSGLQGYQGLLDTLADFALAIDGTKPTWYFRATVNANDHWVQEQRT